MYNSSKTMKQSKLAKIFKALSNEQRLKLFEHICKWQEVDIKNESDNVGIQKAFTKACKCMDLSKSTISHHLKELQNADLITCTRNGQTCLCKVNQNTLEVINKFVATTMNCSSKK
jgi:ArsR family transcriptional regulator, arsenate/arsenite/antimonite-responsive transcriptional repressor